MEHRAGGATLLSSAISLGLGAYLAASQGVLQGAIGMVTGMLVGEALLLLAQLYLSKRVFSGVSQ
jgi:hypothetical protein